MGCTQYTPTEPAWKSRSISPAAALTGTTAAGAILGVCSSGLWHWGCLQRVHLSREQLPTPAPKPAPHRGAAAAVPHPHHLLRTGAGSSLAALRPQSLRRTHLHRHSLRSPPPPLRLFLEIFDGAKSSLWAAERQEGHSHSAAPPHSLGSGWPGWDNTQWSQDSGTRPQHTPCAKAPRSSGSFADKAASKTSVEETKGGGKPTLSHSALRLLPSKNHTSPARPQCHQSSGVSYKTQVQR